MLFPTSTVGRKLLMAFTGQVMLLFLIAHAVGNSTLYFGGLNAYAAHLQALMPLLWPFRVVMIVLFCLHVLSGIQVALENSAARPQQYAVKKDLQATFAGKTMIWTGAIIAAFLIYHLLHFTFQITNPAVSARTHPDALGRPDVLMMVLRSFQNPAISFAYGAALCALGLHLIHGIQSSFQTWGLNSGHRFPAVQKGSVLAAVILFLGYLAIPAVIVTGMIKR